MYIPHSPRPVSEVEAYHRFVSHNKHLLLQIKMYVIFFVGGVIIVICLVYIFIQCRTKMVTPIIRQANNRRTPTEETKTLFGSADTLENLLPLDKNTLPMKIRRDKEFYV